MTTQQYLEGLVLIKEKKELQKNLKTIIEDFRKEGFYDEDIYHYINDLVLDILHTKYKHILDKLKNDSSDISE